MLNTSATREPNPSSRAVVCVRNLYKSYEQAGVDVSVLQDISVDFAQGECVAIVGKSGSGKTTLMNLITGIDAATSGELIAKIHRQHNIFKYG